MCNYTGLYIYVSIPQALIQLKMHAAKHMHSENMQICKKYANMQMYMYLYLCIHNGEMFMSVNVHLCQCIYTYAHVHLSKHLYT